MKNKNRENLSLKINSKTKQKKHINILLLIIIIYIITIIFFVLNMFIFNRETIKLNGKKETNLSVGTTYNDSGYKISSLDAKDFVVEVTSNLDNSKLGTYKIVYNLNGYTVERIVNVVDDIAPVITLNGVDDTETSYVCSGKTYEEEGYTVTDNYDTDLHDKVEVTSEGDTIVYTVTDSSNNKAEVKRKIKEGDKTAPVITFEEENLTLYKGATFTDNYTATDNCDGDVTGNVSVSGTVDTNTVGTYTLNYTVKDKSGNEGSAERTVTIKPAGDTTPTIYLTFDDGPSIDVTPHILDILKENNVKATFFVIGHDTSTDYLIKRAADEGHTIALHSNTHNYGIIYKSDQAFLDDLEQIASRVAGIIGYRTTIMRFPGGSSNTVSKISPGIMTRLTKKVEELGYLYYDWNVGSNDTTTNESTKVCNNVINGLGGGTNIVLMHDYSGKTGNIEALKCIIKYGKSHGYEFKSITRDTKQIHHGINN